MLDELTIANTKALPAAVIRMKIKKEEIRTVMDPAMQELLALIPTGAITPAGRIFSHHFKTDAAHFDFEVGIPVTGAVKAIGRVSAGTLPAKRVIRTIYHGGYEGLGAAWGAFDAQVKGRGERTTGEFWEIYETGPESGPDEGKWRTELAMVLG
jgi:effector-binding domain-containing protein